MPPTNAGLPWTREEEVRLYQETGKGMSVAEVAATHGRTKGAITSRQRQMGLRNTAGELISPLPEFQYGLGTKAKCGNEPLARRTYRSSCMMHTSNGARRENPTTAQPIAWPEDFPWDGNWIEKLWCALRHDMDASLKDGRRPEATVERKIDIALARLTPSGDFHHHASLAELGNKHCVSRERIRQIEVKVLRRLAGYVLRKNSLTAGVLEKMAETVPSEHSKASRSWFAVELARHGCREEFTKFMLKAFLRQHQGLPEKEARRRIEEAMPSIIQLKRAEASLGRRENKGDNVDGANAFVRRILEKAVWPRRLNERLVDLSGFRPLRDCKYERPYYSKTMKRLVGFDSLGERRLIRALDICTVVTEFIEQPIEIGYRLDGRDRTYIPDLLIRTDTDFFFVIEIKGRRQLADRETLAKAEAAERQLGERGIGYCLADANGFGLDDLRSLELDDEFLQRLEELQRAYGVVRRQTFEQAIARERLTWAYDQLQSAVLREGMRYETRLIESQKAATGYFFDFRLRLPVCEHEPR